MIKETFSPYVGLRPFHTDENLLFFGRDEQTLDILQRLHKNRFVAVVGGSGSGKSSLIRAGLIPALNGGFLVEDRSKWLVSVLKPGVSPMFNLAEAILVQVKRQTTDTEIVNITDTEIVDFVKQIKKEGVKAILNRTEPLYKDQNLNFFLLVDQFEELFRFIMDQTDTAKKTEAVDFVNMMLSLSKQSYLPFYVVLTMRSDFIGDCEQFYDLPEALNRSQYLVPRLNRQQLKMVIEGPAKLNGVKFSPALTSQLLNDLGKVKDELPLIQHALMRIWNYEMTTDESGELDLEDYRQIGGIEKALSNHADEALGMMTKEELEIAKQLFKALTAIDESGRKIRRPVLFSQLNDLTDGTEEQLRHIIEMFIKDKRSFLITNKTGDSGDEIIDISHESLIRQWDTLSKWVDEESESASNYLQLVEASILHKKDKKDYLSGIELKQAIEWRDKYKPNAVWANRYKEGFEECMAYLNASEAENTFLLNREKARKQNKHFLVGAIMGLLLILAVVGIWLTREARISEDIAKKSASESNIAKEEALKSKEEAISARNNAEEEKEKAIKAESETLIQSKNALASAREANKQKEIAKENYRIAMENAEMARIEKLNAIVSLNKAEKLVNAFYFYDEKFAIASNNKKEFYFIDKDANSIDILGKWSKAEQFDDYGYARVKDKVGNDYLIDTIGNKYKAAYSEYGIDNSIRAIDLSYSLYGEMSDSIFKAKNLQILFSRSNFLHTISPEIGELKNLKTLDLADNELTSLPNEIGELKNLNRLSLRKNPFDTLPEETWKLEKLTILELDSTQLTFIPHQIGALKDLKRLNLNNNHLYSLPHEIGDLKNLTHLTLNFNQLTSLPNEIGNLTDLTYLGLRNNQLTSLPQEIGELKNLTILGLRNNQLTSTPEEIWNLKNLTELYLGGNQLTIVPNKIGELEYLSKLVLSDNLLQDIPYEIGKLKKLYSLDLSINKLVSLTKEIGELKNLTELYLSSNQMSTLPNEIYKLKNLTKLNLSNNKMDHLTMEISELEKLTWLNLDSNQLISLPKEMGELKNLTELYLRNNQLISLPEEIGELKYLTDFYLRSNQLTSLPKEIGGLKNLSLFDLRNNKLTSFPIEFWELKNLIGLALSNNQLASLPAEIVSFKNLNELHLDSNKITSLPKEIRELKELTWLVLDNNQLTRLPIEIGELTNLTWLSLVNNHLTNLPKEIGELKKLSSIDLKGNKLSSLPKEIEGLEYLYYLYLSNNQLTSLPKEIGKLKNLYSLDLSHNKLNSLPKEIGELQYLYTLNLTGNNISKKDVEKIQKQLPYCNIITGE